MTMFDIETAKYALHVTSRIAPKWTAHAAYEIFCTPPKRMRVSSKAWWIATEAKLLEIAHKGRVLHGFHWMEPGERRPVVMLIHGWGGRALQMYRFVEPLLEAGFEVVAFDGPAHGRSDGYQTNLFDFAEAMSKAARHVGGVDMVVGHSFGGLVTAYNMSRGMPRVKRAVLIGTPNNVEHVIDHAMKRFHIHRGARVHFEEMLHAQNGIEGRNEFNVRTLLDRARKPVLLVHDLEDRQVAFTQAYQLSNDCESEVELYATQNLGHSRILQDDVTVERIVAYLGRGVEESSALEEDSVLRRGGFDL